MISPTNVTFHPSAVHKLHQTKQQNGEIPYHRKTRFPCIYYVIKVELNQKVIHENRYIIGTIEHDRIGDETIFLEYDPNCYLAFFPKDEFSPDIQYEIAYEDQQWVVFEIHPAMSVDALLAGSE